MKLVSLLMALMLATGIFVSFEPVCSEGGQWIMMPDVCSNHDAAPSMDMPSIPSGSWAMISLVSEALFAAPVESGPYHAPRLSEDKPPKS